MQFRNLKDAAISPQATSKFVFYSIDGEPWLMVRPAHEINTPFWNALLKKNAGNKARQVMARTVTAAMLKRDRDEARELYGKHVANVGVWGGWVDDAGVEIAYSQAALEALLAALPDDQFDELRAHCQALANFRADVVSAEDAELTGKPSPTG